MRQARKQSDADTMRIYAFIVSQPHEKLTLENEGCRFRHCFKPSMHFSADSIESNLIAERVNNNKQKFDGKNVQNEAITSATCNGTSIIVTTTWEQEETDVRSSVSDMPGKRAHASNFTIRRGEGIQFILRKVRGKAVNVEVRSLAGRGCWSRRTRCSCARTGIGI